MLVEMPYADGFAPELGLKSATQRSFGNWAIGNIELVTGRLVFGV